MGRLRGDASLRVRAGAETGQMAIGAGDARRSGAMIVVWGRVRALSRDRRAMGFHLAEMGGGAGIDADGTAVLADATWERLPNGSRARNRATGRARDRATGRARNRVTVLRSRSGSGSGSGGTDRKAADSVQPIVELGVAFAAWMAGATWTRARRQVIFVFLFDGGQPVVENGWELHEACRGGVSCPSCTRLKI